MTTSRTLHRCVPVGLSRSFAAAAWIGGVLFAPVVAEANSFTIRLGYLAPRGDSRLWSENVATFDNVVDDFNWIFGGAEFDIELSEYLDIALGVDGYSRSISSHYRDFVRDDGTEVFHDAILRVAPITFGGRFLPVGKFHALRPYVAGGFGLYAFEYRERGEFIDFATAEIFGATYSDRGVGAGAYAAAGLEASLSRSFSVMGEYRRHFVSAGHGGDFGSYGDFDLDAGQLGFGFTFKF
ncbi:MAG: outer membrane beta-barrel protein [Vicinamibacteria bacterium]